MLQNTENHWSIPSKHLPVQIQQQKHRKSCYLLVYSSMNDLLLNIGFSGDFNVDFEPVIVGSGKLQNKQTRACLPTTISWNTFIFCSKLFSTALPSTQSTMAPPHTILGAIEHAWPHPTKILSLYFFLDYLRFSENISVERSLQFDWLRTFLVIIWEKKLSQIQGLTSNSLNIRIFIVDHFQPKLIATFKKLQARHFREI